MYTKKTQISGKICFFIITLLTVLGCELFEGNDAECEKTKWKDVKKTELYLILDSEGSFKKSNTEYLLANANRATATGTIQKYYCSEKKGGYFDFNTTFFPKDIDNQKLKSIIIGQRYGFDFQNDNDYLSIIWQIKYYFDDNKIFKTKNIINKIHYDDLDKNIFGEYSIFLFSNEYEYFEVTE